MNRRQLLQSSAAGLLAGASPAASATANDPSDVYTRIGVKPFINLTATYTINGGTLTFPEVKKAMEDASYYSVNLDELMEKAGAHIASLLQAESAIVTSGAAAALTHATSASMAGADPEKIKQLPDTTGLRNEVIMARQSRNEYDHAFRAAGAKIIEIDTREEFDAALGRRTAMVAVLGTGEPKGKMRLEEIAEAAHKAGVPVLVDGAAELPLRPNPFLSRGADLVAYSGGKILRGPQCAGLLIGRKDLIRAAWLNSAPHHSVGRAMKAGKEEIMGMLAAVELFVNKRDMQAEYKTWESWFAVIGEEITKVPTVKWKVNPPLGASPFPVMEVSWDPSRVGITAGEVYDLLLNGEPRIMSHASGEGSSFIIRPVSMKPEHPPMVGRRLREILGAAPAGKPAKSLAAPAEELSGQWDVEITFASGSTRHTLVFDPHKNDLHGLHVGRSSHARFKGRMDGTTVEFRSALPMEGLRVSYDFKGRVEGKSITGEVTMGEFGSARFVASRSKA
jgi:L-seryl-tRNA(Ser) seleniumtransferase